MKLLTALQAEMLKTKRTASFYFTLLGALPIPLILLLNVVNGGSDLVAIRRDPMNGLFELGTERNGLVFLPVYVILVCTLQPQIEYRNNTWKQVLAAPQTKANVFLAKFLNINGLILLFLIANLVYLTLAIVVMHFFDPELNLLRQPFNPGRFLLRTANAYMTMLAMCTFQYWLGLRFRNFIVPIAVGLSLWITGLMMMIQGVGSTLVEFFPYSIQAFPFSADLQPKMAQGILTSLGYTMVFLLLGFMDFRKRRLTS